ncbi:hypothetical protein BOX15_Mlig026183g2 [Macrostomum lignano]|uniref:C3H1-type domain-containing protein n=2 Tax=Macrostomum lignano TaxID=282301 RepID=A0A267EG86_9PLAT|nr:hypothetical protein BOX15_Mlig026183g2 [Macrostomum lignano]
MADRDKLMHLSKVALQALCAHANISSRGNKADLVSALLAAPDQSWTDSLLQNMEQSKQEAEADDNISTEAARESAAGLDEDIAKAEKEIRLLQLRKEAAQLKREIGDLQRECPSTRPMNRGECAKPAGPSYFPDGCDDAGLDQADNGNELLDRLLSQNRANERMECSGRRKALLIRDFLDGFEQEVVLANGSGGRITYKSRKPNPDSITAAQYLVGNCRLMMQMIKDGALVTSRNGTADTTDLMNYLRYSIQIGELFDAGFGLAQVNRFDEDYRTRQAETGMRWGKESFQLVAKHLIRTGTPANHGVSKSLPQPRQQRFQKPIDPKSLRTPDGEEICLHFNRRGCFRSSCKFRHVCRICFEAHPEANHSTKN